MVAPYTVCFNPQEGCIVTAVFIVASKNRFAINTWAGELGRGTGIVGIVATRLLSFWTCGISDEPDGTDNAGLDCSDLKATCKNLYRGSVRVDGQVKVPECGRQRC
jgi:hypothetical protein